MATSNERLEEYRTSSMVSIQAVIVVSPGLNCYQSYLAKIVRYRPPDEVVLNTLFRWKKHQVTIGDVFQTVRTRALELGVITKFTDRKDFQTFNHLRKIGKSIMGREEFWHGNDEDNRSTDEGY